MTLRSQAMVSNSSGSKSHSATHVYVGYSHTFSEPRYCHLQNRDTSVWDRWMSERNIHETPVHVHRKEDSLLCPLSLFRSTVVTR